MPDFNTVVFATCMTNIFWERKVKSSTGRGFYLVRFERVPVTRGVQYDYTCNCKHYQYRCANIPLAYCKHIAAVRDERCGWDQFLDGGKPVPGLGTTNLVCPKCAGELDYIKHAV